MILTCIYIYKQPQHRVNSIQPKNPWKLSSDFNPLLRCLGRVLRGLVACDNGLADESQNPIPSMGRGRIYLPTVYMNGWFFMGFNVGKYTSSSHGRDRGIFDNHKLHETWNGSWFSVTNPYRFCSKYIYGFSKTGPTYLSTSDLWNFNDFRRIRGCLHCFHERHASTLIQCSHAAFCILLFWTLLVWMEVAQAHKPVINKNRDKPWAIFGVQRDHRSDGAWKWHCSHGSMAYFVGVAKSNQPLAPEDLNQHRRPDKIPSSRKHALRLPIGSIYTILYLHFPLNVAIFLPNVGKYSIHGSYWLCIIFKAHSTRMCVLDRAKPWPTRDQVGSQLRFGNVEK